MLAGRINNDFIISLTYEKRRGGAYSSHFERVFNSYPCVRSYEYNVFVGDKLEYFFKFLLTTIYAQSLLVY